MKNQMKGYASVLDTLKNGALREDLLVQLMRNVLRDYDELSDDTFFEYLLALNAPFVRKAVVDKNETVRHVQLSTGDLDISDARFCFVDIETTHSNVEHGMIIEIGASILRGEEVMDEFHSLVHCCYVPDEIINLTGIDSKMLEDAPQIKHVLSEFRGFLGDCIFVAHNVTFDYSFLFDSFIKHDIPTILNPFLCTVNLARNCIDSPRYKLSFLSEFLGIDVDQCHRALADAKASREIFLVCLGELPKNIHSVQDLINFSNTSVKNEI